MLVGRVPGVLGRAVTSSILPVSGATCASGPGAGKRLELGSAVGFQPTDSVCRRKILRDLAAPFAAADAKSSGLILPLKGEGFFGTRGKISKVRDLSCLRLCRAVSAFGRGVKDLGHSLVSVSHQPKTRRCRAPAPWPQGSRGTAGRGCRPFSPTLPEITAPS